MPLHEPVSLHLTALPSCIITSPLLYLRLKAIRKIMGTKGSFTFFFLLLGTVFLATVSVSVGFAYWEGENPKYEKCVKSCRGESDRNRHLACHARCKLTKDDPEPRREKETHEQAQEQQRGPGEKDEERQPWQERERQKEEERRQEQEQERRRERKQQRQQREEQEQQQRAGLRRWDERRRQGEDREREEEEARERGQGDPRCDPEERARERERERLREEEERQRREEEERRRRERQKWEEIQRKRREREQSRKKREQQQEKEEQQEEEERQSHNPYHFRSDKFQTWFKNELGRIRVLPRFKFPGDLQNYRVVEFEARPNTFLLPHHADAEQIMVVVRGNALFTLVDQNNRKSYNLERGDVLRIPAGFTVYAANLDDNENLRIAKLVIPVNAPGRFEEFYPFGRGDPQSYFSGFSKEIIEASFDSSYEEIKRILVGSEQRQSSEEEGVIIKVSEQQIKELSQHAKFSPRGRSRSSSKIGPFNLRHLQPRYANKFGRLYEARPENLEQLKDLGISVICVELNEGGLMLPHYNSKTIVVALVVEGKGSLEMGSAHPFQRSRNGEEEEEEEQEEQEESRGQVQKVAAELSQGDAILIPAGRPISLRASENLHVLAFGLNDENNQRNFLAGEKDNVLNQIERPAKELTFAGSGEEVESLLENQKQSYFASAKPQQREGRRAPLSSILGAFF